MSKTSLDRMDYKNVILDFSCEPDWKQLYIVDVCKHFILGFLEFDDSSSCCLTRMCLNWISCGKVSLSAYVFLRLSQATETG